MPAVSDVRVGMRNSKITPRVKVQGGAVQAWMGGHGVMAEAPPPAHPRAVPFGDTAGKTWCQG